MAQLSRHASLRFSVFDVAFDAGIESQQLDGNFTPILEGDESEEVASPSKQRQTHSSDELTDSPYPLTPPESATGIGRGLLGKKAEDHPRFIERFATPTPENIFSASNPSTPKPAKPVLGKLRKAQTSPLEIDLTQDSDREPRRRDAKVNREDGKQSAKARSKSKDASREKHQFPTSSPADEDEKKGLSGLLRFRTKSKERKAAAKQANQVITEEQMPPPRPHTPPPLPIAGKFARQAEEVTFRPTVRESGSSHAGTSSIGHVSNSSVGDSSETHESYPKARNRSSRYERPHPAWRTVPSGLGAGKLRKNSPVEEEKLELPEVHAYPPGQTIFDREPVRPSTGSEPPKEPEQPQVDMDAINAYYGFTDEPVSTQPSTPLPQARVALVEALSPIESKRPDPLDMGRATPVPQPSAPVSPSPFIVPSPNPAQNEFGSQARSKRGGVNFTVPPPINSGLTPPRRMTNAHNPPPTPPPTTELPPIPTQPPHVSPSPGLQVTIPDQQSYLSPYPPSAHRSPSPLTPLGSRSSSPNLRSVSPSQPSPLIGQRPGTAPQQAGPSPSLPPVQRGKVSPFPTRPITPTNRPITPTHRPITPTHRPITPTVQTVVAPASPAAGYSPISGNSNYLLTRRPDFDSSNVSRPKGNSSDNIFVRPNRAPQQLRFTESTIFHTRPSTEEDHYLVDPASPPAPRRNRSIRKSKYRSGYDSDDAESRYSRDTYYGRETAYFDDSNIPDIPSMGRGSSDAPPMPRRNFSDQEDERKMGRERLLRMLETQNQTRDRPRYF